MKFNSLGLTEELLQAVNKRGYKVPTPIQAQAIPAILKGRDLMGGAQTGTGKTAAFALPLLHNLSQSDKRSKHPRALIITPTRELAAQVGESFQSYGQKLPLRTTVIFGGVKINPQIGTLRKGTDILVATPGRLMDHLAQKTLNLNHIETLVLDEADRMLDMGFIRDIRKILTYLPAERQNLLFSATYSKEIRKLAGDILQDPLYVEVARRNKAADKVEQLCYPIEKTRKLELLTYLINKESWYQVLVFARTKHGADRWCKKLNKAGIPSGAIHGNKTQNARNRALGDFKKGDLQVLVATDVAARGIHLEQLSHVVNFDLPQVAEDYIHRIGRTGRAGKSGQAISFVSPDEKDMWNKIQKLLKEPVESIDPLKFLPAKRETPETDKRQPAQNSRHAGRAPSRRGERPGKPASRRTTKTEKPDSQGKARRPSRKRRPPRKPGNRSESSRS